MRKVAFIDNDETKKIMLYETEDGTYLFYFDTWVDTASIKDYLYDNVEEVEAVCFAEFGIKPSDWVNINDPQDGCQQDFIAPTRVKGRDVGSPQYGYYQRFSSKWFDIDVTDHVIGGLTGNERLFCSGLMDEYDDAKRKKDILKCRQILRALKWDELSLNKIIESEFSD